ncbi:Stp1/IreP family PP2C-type Ser/Thr phosphatase [Candidatus Parabeggiatoa sp. HSG14]|uniref:Stp1/IreP family PP2C-type Ser/Thr phosphatase n=1 Tax=Candidatus Parabeggiatoa sp. HSG14 TaxID=3055593 RepID=UPI0025A84747|nr:Stp1/IreP family PP2C-type Ser/Thr phosphatase [Thiotrichales bacterium HSG14]
MCVIKMICGTDTGQMREHNEDCISGDESLGVAILADGMGGYQAGEVASAMAVNTIMNYLKKTLKTLPHVKHHFNYNYHSATVLLEQAVLKANQVIYKTAEQEINYRGMGTTIVAALFHNNCVSIAHVGDSRLYRLRGNEFRQITKDHSVRQELIDCGFYTPEQARHSPNKNLVTRALGVAEQVNVEIQEHNLLAQDIYLLCSDGLNDMIDDSDIHKILSNADTPEQAAQSLIAAANAKGGEDNISLILVYPLQILLKPQKSWLQRLFSW